MPSIAQGQRFTNTSSTQLVVGGIVLLFVVGLFFVPQVVPPRETTAENVALEQALSGDDELSFEELLGSDDAEPVAPARHNDIRARHMPAVNTAEVAAPSSPGISPGAFDRFDVAALLGGQVEEVEEYAEVAPAGPVDEIPENDDRILVADNSTDEDTALGKVSRLLQDLSTPEHRRAAAEELVPDDMNDNQAVGLETVAMQQRREGASEKANSSEEQESKKEEAGELFPAGEGVTWKLIHNGKNKRKIRKAGKNAQKIAISLGHKYQGTRFAIQNYVGGLNRVMIGKGLKAHEVPQFMANLEKEVTVAMRKEGVSQAEVLQWAAISLGPELQTVLERQRKEEMVKPFDPRIRLSKLKVRQGYKHRGKWDPKARVAVKLTGYINGKHVKKIELYRNGKRVKKLPLEKRADDDGNRVFRMRQGQHVRNSVYTFKVTDSKDRVFEKSYLFYPKVRAFKWKGREDGSFAIPFQEDDPRLDVFFRSGGRSNSGFGSPSTKVAFARF